MESMISRREVMAGAASVAIGLPSVARASSSVTVPKPLAPGSHIRLVCPAGRVADAKEFSDSEASLGKLGFRVSRGKSVSARLGYLAGTDEQRAEDLMEAFLDPEVDGIVAVRGGYGCARLFEHLDFDSIAKSPKALIGYSDITALHLALLARANLASFHGPCGNSTFDQFTVASFKEVVMGGKPPTWSNAEGDPDPLNLKAGEATGRLIGGNLAVFCSLYGTPYMPDLNGAILFFEDIGEEPYKIDRMLTQLRLGGAFAKAAGLIFGRFTNADSRDPDESANPQKWSVGDVLRDRTHDFEFPVVAGLPIGHIKSKLTLPVGLEVSMPKT